MKIGVKGFFLFLILLVGVSYNVSAISECWDPENPVHGVEIAAECYFCGDPGDGVCPSFYGANCSAEEIANDEDCGPSSGEDYAYWMTFYEDTNGEISGEEISEAEIQFDSGNEVFYAIVESSNFKVGDEVTFTVSRYGGLVGIDKKVFSSVVKAEEMEGVVVAYVEWTADESDFPKGGEIGETESFFFEAKKESFSIKSSNLELTVVAGEDICDQIQSCDSYTDEESCGANESLEEGITLWGDFCNQFYSEETITDPLGCTGTEYWFCLWNSTDCNQATYTIFDSETETCVNTKCEYTTGEISGGSCDDGAESIIITYDPVEESDECPVKQKTYMCPSFVELPFFNLLNLLISVIVIASVYFYNFSRKKKSKEK